MHFGWPEIVGILLIVILLFGVGRIGKIAGELGGGLRAFRQGLKDDEEKETKETKETKNTDES